MLKELLQIIEYGKSPEIILKEIEEAQSFVLEYQSVISIEELKEYETMIDKNKPLVEILEYSNMLIKKYKG